VPTLGLFIFSNASDPEIGYKLKMSQNVVQKRQNSLPTRKKTEGYQLLSLSSVDSRGLETRPDAGQTEVGKEDEWVISQTVQHF
jgi:hypothetical protein